MVWECRENGVSFLKEHFVNDDSKEHYLIDDTETAQVRKQKRGDFNLEPCKKYHVIAVDSDDTFSKSMFFRDVRIESLFRSGDVDEFNVDDEYDYEKAFALNHDTVFELAEPGTYVVMRNPTDATESLFIAEVQNKGIAKENLTDENGHHILSGEQYLEIVYLQKKEQKKAKVKYQHPKKYKLISIHTAEVFITNVALDENLCMDLNEYQSVMAAAI